MRRRNWILLGVGVAVLAVAIVAVAEWRQLVRLAVIAQVRAATGRSVTIDTVHVDPFTGHLSIRGFRLADRDGSPFADFEELDARVHRRSLLRGHLWIQDLTIRNSAV